MEEEKFEINHEIKCPYCGWEDCDSWESSMEHDGDDIEYECDECGKKFHVTLHIEHSFWSRGLCDENNDKHNWEKFKTEKGSGRKCLTCDEYEFNKDDASLGEGVK